MATRAKDLVPSDQDEAVPIRAGEEFDEAGVLRFLAAHADELELSEIPTSLETLQFPSGKANLTYLLRLGGREFVLRRPPLGAVGARAHDMGREFKVLSRLWRAYSPAPRAFLYSDDAALIGAPFFVMERRKGVVVRYEIPDSMRAHADVERRTMFALVDAMADLHGVEFDAHGLSDLGQPDQFLARQLSGWEKRFEAVRDRELPDFEALGRWLNERLPTTLVPSLVHNDLKLDNCQFDPADPDHVTSIFDWDMTTLGDPLADLGTLLGYMSTARSDPDNKISASSIFAGSRFPNRADVIERYATRTGLSVSGIRWYEALALWKSAVILQQIFIRYQRGQTQDERFARMGERVPELVALGLAVAAGEE